MLDKCILAAGWKPQINPATYSYFYTKASSSVHCRYPLKCNTTNVEFSLFASQSYPKTRTDDLVVSVYHIPQNFTLFFEETHLLKY